MEQRLIGQWKWSLWYNNDEHISLHICPNQGTCNTKNEFLCKLWTLDDYDMLYRFTLGKKCTILVNYVDNRGGYACMGAWDI